MFLSNAKYLDGDFQLRKGDLELNDKKIQRIGEKLPYRQEDMVVDCGFVDVHIHGCDNADTCDGSREAIDKMARFLLQRGVTSFCPTTMTVDQKTIERALLAAKACYDAPLEDGARVVGVNMEGPFIAAARKGAQLESAILPPDLALFKHF